MDLSLSCCSSLNVYVPLVLQHTTITRTHGWDVLWGENKRPVVARVNETSLVRVVQTNDLSSRDPFDDSTACSIFLYPNCCRKTALTDLSKTQIFAGILYTNDVLNISTEIPTNILRIHDLKPSICPDGTSWQYEQDSIKCKPIPCPAGEDVHGYECRSCQVGRFKRTEGIERCEPCPVNTYAPSIGTSVCLDCPANSKTNGTGASSMLECVCEEGRVRDGDVCVVCQEGTFMAPDATGKLVCRPCPQGTFQNAKGQRECVPCPIDTFGPEAGLVASSQCQKCIDPLPFRPQMVPLASTT